MSDIEVLPATAAVFDDVEYALVGGGNGARTLEAYPFDTSVQTIPTNDLYLGVLSVFLNAGFTEIARTHPHRAIVTLELRS